MNGTSLMEQGAEKWRKGRSEPVGPIAIDQVKAELAGVQRAIGYSRIRLEQARKEVAEMAETLEELRKREETLLKTQARLDGMYEKATVEYKQRQAQEEERKLKAMEEMRLAVAKTLGRDCTMEDAIAFVLEGKGVEGT